jgi:predicted metal-binding membrane protein
VTRRDARTIPAALVLVAGLAWWLSVDRMDGMDGGPSAQLGGFGWFTATWVLMMAAMMLPAMAPTLRMWDAERSRHATRWRQIVGPIATVVAYLAVWTLAGALTYLVLRAGRSLLGEALQWHRSGHELCVAVIVVAAAYQLTHTKDRWLARCHAPAISADATVADGLAAGGRAGLRCLASSWALMAALFALGAMSLVWMAVVAALIGVERLAPRRWWRTGGRMSIRVASATLLVALAAAVAASPAWVPGFTIPGSSAARQAMSRMNTMHMAGAGMGPSRAARRGVPATMPMHR